MAGDTLRPANFDFTALDPKPFAVAAFVLLPGLAGLVSALAIERLLLVQPWSNRPLAGVLALGSVALVPVLPAVAVLYGAAFALRRKAQAGRTLTGIARAVVPIALAVVTIRSGIELWGDADDLL